MLLIAIAIAHTEPSNLQKMEIYTTLRICRLKVACGFILFSQLCTAKRDEGLSVNRLNSFFSFTNVNKELAMLT